MSERKPALGYIGMGLMGRPMTERLLAAGYRVMVWNRTAAKLAPVLERGAVAVASPAAVTRISDIVFDCVTDTAAQEAVVFGPDGIRQGAAADKLFVDFSSIRPDATRDMAARLRAETGMGWIDAPVSGGVVGAEAGSLAIMCGGRVADVERVRPVVMNLCQRLTHMGDIGAGQTTKLCNQVITGCTMAVVAEAVNLARRSGVDAAMLTEALAGGWADSKILQTFVPRMTGRDFDPPLGAIHTILKDMDSATGLGREYQAALPMTATAAELVRLYGGRGHMDDCATSFTRIYDKSRLPDD